jgi:ArsR family transcriptional regulator
VIAVDGSTDMVQAARKRLKGLHQVEVRRGDMEALPIDDGMLDVAIVALVLHHVPGAGARAGGEINRVLKCRRARDDRRQMLRTIASSISSKCGHVWLGFLGEDDQEYLDGAGVPKRRRCQRCPPMTTRRARACLSQQL